MSSIVRFRAGYAIPHLRAASHFAVSAAEIERQNVGNSLGPFYDEIVWHVSACVMLSVAALEANANEFLADPRKIPQLSQAAHEVVVDLLDRASIVEKYQKITQLIECPSVDFGIRPAQDALILIKLRNALVHFRPEWSDQQVKHAQLAKQLVGKFPFSPFIPKETADFPQRTMSAGCGNWAVRTAVEFMHRFHEISGTDFKFGKEMYEQLLERHFVPDKDR